MKWFKHFSDASNDEFISDLEDEFGLIGYGRWWKLLESIAAQMEAGSNKCSASYSEKKWCRKLQCKPKVLVRFLECTDNAGKTKTERNGNILEISCCKLLELRDNHSKNLQVDRKQLAPDLPLDVDVEVEVEKAIDTTNKNEKKVKKESKTSLPENFTISDRVKEWAIKGNHNPTQDDLEAFSLHHMSKGNKFVDWDAAFMKWMRNKKKFSNDQGSPDEPRNKRLN